MDRRGLFPIGEVAKLFHLSVGTLRHYERLGLLPPEYVDPNSGYRYYSTRQFESLNTIRYLRLLGTPLGQIRDFLQNREVDRIQDLLRQQKEEVGRRRRELEIVERKLDRRLDQLQEALEAKLDEPTLKELPPRRAANLTGRLSPQSYLDLEPSIRQLDAGQGDPVVFLGKVGVGITLERLLAGDWAGYDLVFLLLDEEDVYGGAVEVLPGGTWASLCFRGGHQQAGARYGQLAAFLRENGLRPTGPSREITLIDNGFTHDSSKFVTEIQIPVERKDET